MGGEPITLNNKEEVTMSKIKQLVPEEVNEFDEIDWELQAI